MSMLRLSRRLQILIDDQRFERLERAAHERSLSVGAFVREAIDEILDGPDRATRRKAAFEAFVQAEPIDWGSAENVKRLIEDAHVSASLRAPGDA